MKRTLFPNAGPWQARHRGPYRFMVVRPSKGKHPWRYEWLAGEVSTDDVEDEALALLGDKRDSIVRIQVWSTREEQFVWTFYRPPTAGAKKRAA